MSDTLALDALALELVHGAREFFVNVADSNGILNHPAALKSRGDAVEPSLEHEDVEN
jgi:hypothetical protein